MREAAAFWWTALFYKITLFSSTTEGVSSIDWRVLPVRFRSYFGAWFGRLRGCGIGKISGIFPPYYRYRTDTAVWSYSWKKKLFRKSSLGSCIARIPLFTGNILENHQPICLQWFDENSVIWSNGARFDEMANLMKTAPFCQKWGVFYQIAQFTNGRQRRSAELRPANWKDPTVFMTLTL